MSWVDVSIVKPRWQSEKRLLVNDVDDGPIVVIGVHRDDYSSGDEDIDCNGYFDNYVVGDPESSKRWEHLEPDSNVSGKNSKFSHWMEIPSITNNQQLQ